MSALLSGWAWPPLSRKVHYFGKGLSLCHGWLYSGELDPVQDMPDLLAAFDAAVREVHE